MRHGGAVVLRRGRVAFAIDEPKVQKVVDELRDQNATLAPVEDRGARNGDYAVIGYSGTKAGVPFEGGSAERMPLILGEERLIPGFEANLLGLQPGEKAGFDITFPDDYPEASLVRPASATPATRCRPLRKRVRSGAPACRYMERSRRDLPPRCRRWRAR